MNWDSAAILLIAEEHSKTIIVAAVAEGKSLSTVFINKPFTHNKSSYIGQCTRDHLEVCITELSLISSTIRKHSPHSIKAKFSEEYNNHLLDYLSAD